MAALALVSGCAASSPTTALSRHTIPAREASTSAPAPSIPAVSNQVRRAVFSYFNDVNQALRSGDLRRLDSDSVASCNCRALARYIASVFAKGRPVGARFDVIRVTVHDVHGHVAASYVSYRVPAYELVDRHGVVIGRYTTHVGEDDMSWVDVMGRWTLVTEIRLK